jgi:hypothetical protein
VPPSRRLDLFASRRSLKQVNDAAALAEIQRLARLDRLVFTRHARERMSERGAERGHVRNALATSTQAIRQDRGTWCVKGGVDHDGDEMTVICDIEADVIVVTIF